MRLIRNIILLILLAISIFWLYLSVSPYFYKQHGEDDRLQSVQFRDASVKIAYVLDKEKWLTYALQPGEELVRVMSNAILNKNYKIAEDERFLYAIDYEILNGNGDSIKPGRFYHKAGQKLYLDKETGQQYVSTSIYPADANPLDSRIHIINLRGFPAAEKIRFRLAFMQAPVEGIVLRAHQKKKTADRKLDSSWQRLGESRRQQLAKVSVYGADIITEQEKRQLVKNIWGPMGPLGVDGDDYIIQKLYVAREIENDIQLNIPPVPSSGLVVYPDRYGIINLPAEDNKLRLSWKLFDSSIKASSSDKITVEWWGRPATRYKKWQAELAESRLDLNMGTGIIRISTDRPIVIRAWRKDEAGALTEITPKPAYLRLYSPASPGLVYKVNHIRGFKTPFRFDLRAFGEQRSAVVKYQLLDKYDRPVRSGSIHLNQELSHYDGVVADAERWLTEPRRIYFNLPRRISKVRFDAPAGVWVSAFTRPKNLAHVSLDPLTEEQRKLSMPVWFAVRPEQWKDYLIKSRSQLITLQRHPPQIDYQLLSGLYRWDQFLPEGVWKGRYILNALEGPQVFREEALASRYIQLPLSMDKTLEFVSRTGTNKLRPSLIYSRNASKDIGISVWLDGDLYFTTRIQDKNGELQLPYMPAGKHIIRIEADTGEEQADSKELAFYINYSREEKNLFLKRMGIEIPSKGLAFKVRKEKAQELLALRIYTRLPMDQPINVKVKLNGIDGRARGPYNDWTIGRRLYRLSRKNEDTHPIMLNTDHRIGNGRLFFIPLGADLPVNKTYTVEISVDNDRAAYMVMTRTIPGLYPDRRLYSDIELEVEQ